MKKQIFRFLVAFVALFSFMSVSAQDVTKVLLPSGAEKIDRISDATASVNFYSQGDTIYWYKGDNWHKSDTLFYRHKKVLNVVKKGLHVDFDAAFSPFGGGWKVAKTETNYEATEKINYTVGANVALVYQTKGDVRVGGGTGIRIQQLEYVENGAGQLSKSYGIPLYARAGIGRAVSKNLAIGIDINLGILIGTNNLKTSPLWDAQFSCNYNNAKIGIGWMSTNPKGETFIPEYKSDLRNGYALNFALFLGFTI